ncbi:MAG: HAD family phosphatase [Clostridia bacterium]|nr:HAD family phosphatase [Clostridia bacterium]
MQKRIKNIVFDMGRVLLDFSPQEVIAPYFSEPKEQTLIHDVVFDSGDWFALDEGNITEEEALAKWCACVPEHMRGPLTEMFRNWYRALSPIDGMEELIAQLKAHGYRCYLLSNTSVRFSAYWQEFAVLRMLDGHYASAFYHLVKPDSRAYLKMTELFSLDPEECFFVDDREENVAGAERVGMRGYTFSPPSVQKLIRTLRENGVNI